MHLPSFSRRHQTRPRASYPSICPEYVAAGVCVMVVGDVHFNRQTASAMEQANFFLIGALPSIIQWEAADHMLIT